MSFTRLRTYNRRPRINPNCFRATYEGDEVWFVLDETYLHHIPLHITSPIVYTLKEARYLATQSPWTRRMAHEAKRHGAQLKLPPPPRPPQPSPPTHPKS